MDAMQKPTHYASTEGGPWEPWPFGYLNTNYLAAHIKDVVDLTVLPIQAVKFEDGTIFDMPINEVSDNPSLPKLSQQPDFFDSDNNLQEDGCTCDPDPREMACNHCLNMLKDKIVYKLGDSLNEAHSIINGERQDSYGNPEDSFGLIAEYWSTYLRKEYNSDHHHLRAKDVAHMMMLFKIARCTGQQFKRDNYIDIQGYAAIAADRLVKE